MDKEATEFFFKAASAVIGIGTIIYLAGKVRQIVEYLREAVSEMRAEAKTFRDTLVDHGERLASLEARRGKR